MIDENTWIISDTHFGHQNIIRFCNRPWDHEDIILRNWMLNVQKEDTILHLGDVAFGKAHEVYKWTQIMSELPGKKFLIKGNHDHSKSMKLYKAIFKVVDPFVQEFGGKKIYFSHYPDHPTSCEWDINIHGHIHNNPYDRRFFEHVDLSKIYCNVSIEVQNYAPEKLKNIFARLDVPF